MEQDASKPSMAIILGIFTEMVVLIYDLALFFCVVVGNSMHSLP